MPLSGSGHRLSTTPRSSSRRSAGYSVPSFKSKNPFDRSRSSRRIWKPYFSSFARRASRHSWIEPFFSSAVHSGETSGIRFASYPGLAISAFGPDPNLRRLFGFGHAVASLQGKRSSSGFGSQKKGGGETPTSGASPSLAGTRRDLWQCQRPPAVPRGSRTA